MKIVKKPFVGSNASLRFDVKTLFHGGKNTFVLGGRNNTGKTAFLEAIWQAYNTTSKKSKYDVEYVGMKADNNTLLRFYGRLLYMQKETLNNFFTTFFGKKIIANIVVKILDANMKEHILEAINRIGSSVKKVVSEHTISFNNVGIELESNILAHLNPYLRDVKDVATIQVKYQMLKISYKDTIQRLKDKHYQVTTFKQCSKVERNVFYLFLVAASMKSSSILLIDDIEYGLHVNAQNKIVEALTKITRSKLVITTNSAVKVVVHPLCNFKDSIREFIEFD